MNTKEALKRLGRIQVRLFKLIAQIESAKLDLITDSLPENYSTGTDFQEDHIR